MARVEIKYDDYKVKAFLDANIILEGRPLPELPWQEIDAEGPILALITPTAIKEIDSKKQDGRIGKRAREFNRLISPVAAGGAPIVIRESAPRVELAFSRAFRIPWDEHDDLDPDDGDSCIVAEALHARDMSPVGKLMVSHDIKPIAFASNYDMATLHVSDGWLRQPEPHPKDREIQKLTYKLAEYQATEPAFEICIELPDAEPVGLVRIEDLSNAERAAIHRRIHDLNPAEDQVRGTYGIMSGFGTYDHSYNERYEAYRKSISIFMENYSQRLERLFNQTRVRLTVSNIGKMQAEDLLIEVKVANGWLHERFVFVSPQGPKKPQVRTMPHLPTMNIGQMIRPRVGLHEFEYKDAPNCGPSFAVTCADFRHGQDYTFNGVLSLDVRATETTKISVVVTASNFRGTIEDTKAIERTIETLHISDLIDLEALRVTATTPLDEIIDRQDYDKIDFGAFYDGDYEGDD